MSGKAREALREALHGAGENIKDSGIGRMGVSAAGCGRGVKGGDLSPTLECLPTKLCISLGS